MPNLDIRITSMYPPGTQGSTRAYASATIDGCFAVRGIKIVEGGRDGLFVSMPSRKTQEGYKEVCFPVTAEFREQLHSAVLDSYRQALTMAQADTPQQAAPAEAPTEQPTGMQMAGM
ncbi:SpoVG family protein [Agathobaculum sp. NTUH-O15-33]|uniref:SpoVG family protein n=1 Tax=Agathobaculum sp. NTUH-O15-33 TaxID=3079302 RepID=UPI00295849A4|nr:SpoVG family protein [Agathobaculum sp. NTUH-O15-33]WNX84736.1 SpoVG family protein [Agathobaculum sp. NTUH-O15-33]